MNRDKLQIKMAECNFSNAELSRAVGITEAYISQIVNGLRIPSVEVAKRIAEALNCKIDDLV